MKICYQYNSNELVKDVSINDLPSYIQTLNLVNEIEIDGEFYTIRSIRLFLEKDIDPLIEVKLD